MLKINKTNISLTRGDSAYITLSITDGSGNPIELTENDIVRCQVRYKPNDRSQENILLTGEIIRRSQENGPDQIVWWIRPYETKYIDLDEQDTFFWDAQVEFANSDVFTIVQVSPFKILPEVSMTDD